MSSWFRKYSASSVSIAPASATARMRPSPSQARTQPRGTEATALQPRRKTVGLLGLFGQGNFGNDGSLEAMLVFLRTVTPELELACICTHPAVVEACYSLASVPIGRPRSASKAVRKLNSLLLTVPSRLLDLVAAVRHARRLDVIIIPGTGILDDFGEGPLGMPATLFTWCLAARLCRTKVAFASIGAGPIFHPISRWLMRTAAGMAQYRSYRDKISKDYMTGIGADTRNDPIFPDVAFSLPSGEADMRAGQPTRPLTVGVGVMTYCGWDCDPVGGAEIYTAYLAKMTAFIDWLLDQGYSVRIVMGDAGDGPAREKIRAAVAARRQDLAPARLVSEPANSLDDIMRQLAQTDVVVATRFHNVVCALKLARPTISIGYAQKNDVLMAEMGLGEFCQHIERLDVDLLIGQFKRLQAGKARYVEKIRATNAAYREQLRQQDALLLEKFLA